MDLNKTYRYILAITEPGPAAVLLLTMRLFSTFKVFCLIISLYVIQKISITQVVVQPIIYRKKFTVFQRGAVKLI